MDISIAPAGITLAFIGIAGFGIQQLLQILDPLIEEGIGTYKARRASALLPPLPNEMTEAAFKRAVMGGLAAGLGTLIALGFDVRVLAAVGASASMGGVGKASVEGHLLGVVDLFVSGLVIGAGTDGANTLVKYLGYVKDARGLAVAALASPESPSAPIASPRSSAGGVSSRFTSVGSVGRVTVYYETEALGQPGERLAEQLLARVSPSYDLIEELFGVPGEPVNVIIARLSPQSDGSVGAYHGGCDFVTGGVLYIDATFNCAGVDPVELALGGFVAELSECFMGVQARGWTCTYSNGEALSRLCAQFATAPGTMDRWSTGPDWARAGFPDFISVPAHTDGDSVSIGCAIVYLYWMRSQGFTIKQLIQAGGDLRVNYRRLTGKSAAYADLRQAAQTVTITSDNPW